jgi:hypothetical protein
MNHILKYIKNICTAQENPVSDIKNQGVKDKCKLKNKPPVRPLFGKS